MKEVLLEGASGLQSDTIEGAIEDSEFPGEGHVHFTSAHDSINCKWVPVLMSLLFGKSKNHCKSHWKSLFASHGEEVNKSWKTFTEHFPGTTVD